MNRCLYFQGLSDLFLSRVVSFVVPFLVVKFRPNPSATLARHISLPLIGQYKGTEAPLPPQARERGIDDFIDQSWLMFLCWYVQLGPWNDAACASQQIWYELAVRFGRRL